MNQEHYKAIAEIVRDCTPAGTDAVIAKKEIVERLADYFAQTDPHWFCTSPDICLVEPGKFDRAGFVAACYKKKSKT